MDIRVGIGSWGDDAYVGVLYPKELPKAERLREYARSLEHVEVNSTYYAMPKPEAVRGWVAQTPDGFSFSVKLHRVFSQSPVKAAGGPMLERLRASMEPLAAAGRLAAYLLLLPATFSPGRHRLEELETLAKRLAPHPLAVELRHRGWVDGAQRAATLATFRALGLAWVAVDMPAIEGSTLPPAVDEVTHPECGYLRLHGRNPAYLAAETAAEAHAYEYGARELSELATRARTLAKKARQVFVIANNHAEDFAPKAALELRRRLGVRV